MAPNRRRASDLASFGALPHQVQRVRLNGTSQPSGFPAFSFLEQKVRLSLWEINNYIRCAFRHTGESRAQCLQWPNCTRNYPRLGACFNVRVKDSACHWPLFFLPHRTGVVSSGLVLPSYVLRRHLYVVTHVSRRVVTLLGH